MSYIDATFERGGDLVKTLAKVYVGWDSSKKKGFQFYDQQHLDYKGGVTLRVAVWMGGSFSLNSTTLDQTSDCSTVFPMDFTAKFNDGSLEASIASGRLSILVSLGRRLPWIVTSTGKPAVDWGPLAIAEYRNTAYLLRHMLVFNLPSSKRGDYKEWDLLPFLPGGLIERNRRKH
jgi:hypothetical protein